MRFLGDASSAVLALALAIMVWLAATQAAEPMRERKLEGPLNGGLPIVLVGVPSGMATYGLSASAAQVTVRGIADDVAALTPDGVVVRANLTHMGSATGAITASLEAECVRCGGRAARIVAITPQEVVLHVEPAARRQVPVEPAMEAPGVQNCRGVDATFAPAKVMVEGAASRVALVKRVIAQVQDGGALTASGAAAVAVTPIAADGDPVADVTVSPSSVSAAITYVSLDTCADVAVLPVYSDPPSGYYVADIDVSPDHIQLHGEPDRLAAYREDAVVLTERIDISQSHESVQRLAVLDLPADLETVGAVGGVTVTIRVSPVPGTRSIEVQLEAGDIPDGLTLDDLSPTRVAVLLSGPLPVLDALDEKALRGIVSLARLGAGTHRLSPRIVLPAGLRVRSIAPSEVEARLVRGAGGGG